jgi:hypothetical protein
MKNSDLRERLAAIQAQLVKRRILIFVIFVALVYGYTIVQIGKLSTAEPTSADIVLNEQSQGEQSPHIDPQIINKIENLKDNSVSVKALFDQARQNPFQE